MLPKPNKLVSVPTLETRRLILRGWRDSDVDPWVAMNADERVMEFFPHAYERAYAEEFAVWARSELERNGFGWWVVEVKDEIPFAGVVCVQQVPFDAPFTPAKEIGWRLAVAAWGRGFAYEGARAALDYVFQSLGWSDVVAMTSTLNVRSQKLMQRLGMTHDPKDDFDHPRLPEGHRLRRHVLYRIKRG